MDIGELIRQKREAKGVSQQECADALGLHHRASYHKIETGKMRWKLDDFMTVSRLLGEEPWQILKEWMD